MIMATSVLNNSTAWKRPTIITKPTYTSGTKDPVICLNTCLENQWYFSMNPLSTEHIEAQNLDSYDWHEIIVPGEVAMQGYNIENDTPYYYTTSFMIPEDYDGKHVILRFHGIYSKAKVWINGLYNRDHQGGFTTWDCDITDQIRAGQATTIVVEFIDDIWDPSIGSKYAHHNIGGILRSIELIAVPKTHLTRFHYDIEFDTAYNNAFLHVSLGAELNQANAAYVQLELTDQQQSLVTLEEHSIFFEPEQQHLDISFNIQHPKKWNAEQPYLYTLHAKLFDDEHQLIEQAEVQVGFRQICFAGKNGTDPKEIYINGERIKLRGTCRHSIHPKLGRTTTPEMDIQDVILLREQNVNYVRTSHYPPSEEFLAACDELGMYVEEETAVNFQYANGPGPWRDDEPWYMNQLAEMIERDRSHPSVIIWSLANESGWHANEEGDKFRRQLQYVQQEETTRPTKFSYPFLVEDGSTTDIYSAHYIDYTNDMDYHLVTYGVSEKDIVINYSSPVIHDEYAHIACYNIEELERDNNVRNFWGESVYKMWDKIVNTHGALGGALWANIDDIFFLPEGVPERHQQHSIGTAAGYGEWGNMSDVWRRQKPEYWMTKKAYSPIRIMEGTVGNPGYAPLVISISNWFNHTNLNEVNICYSIHVDGQIIAQPSFYGPDIKPYSSGQLELPARDWSDRERIHLQFQTSDGIVVDEYLLPIATRKFIFCDAQYEALKVEETDEQYLIRNNMVSFTYCKESAMLSQATFQNRVILTGGPHLNLTGVELGHWIPGSIHVETCENDQQIVVTTTGHYTLGIKVLFVQKLFASGKFEIRYTVDNVELELEIQELGVAIDMPEHIDYVEWQKSGRFSVYPENHIGRLTGRANRVRKASDEQPDVYGEQPAWEWKDDMRNYYLERKDDSTKGIVTNDFQTMREYIHFYAVGLADTDATLRVESNGNEAARIAYMYQPPTLVSYADTDSLTYKGEWQHLQDSKAIIGTVWHSNTPGSTIELSFYGTGVQFMYKKHKTGGTMHVHVDDQPKHIIGTHSDIGMPLYQQRFTCRELPLAYHKITIGVPFDYEGAEVVIEAFEILNDTIPAKIIAQLIINQAWYYPALGWGNYCGEPIRIESGYSQMTTFRMTNNPQMIIEYGK
ncbi:glycoside hydrolase family 2 protein [Paenibacillus sp. FSL P4-0184]|uniref:glycoside hydrolase family 2 protein n=1 Tax=Paenibacillus sp. FSL P4-0184 TaxID=2921632 RepID=UPI0030FBA529